MYNDKVMEIFAHPKNVGEVKGANAIGTVGNAKCGDIMKLFLKINDSEVIEDASFKTFGCAAAIVSSSVATEMIKGKTIEEALKLENQEILDYLGGLPDQKIHCSILAKEAIVEAIKYYRKKQSKKLIKPETKEKAKNISEDKKLKLNKSMEKFTNKISDKN